MLSLAILGAAIVLLRLGVEPVPTWFYVFAWYPTLFIFNEVARRAERATPSHTHWRALVSAWAWSAPVWLVFELFNFRLANWYYVFLPRHPVERWSGIILAFATVVPAVLLAERALRALGVGRTWQGRPHPVTRATLPVAVGLGVLQLVLALGWPATFFPLVWGGMLLLCEPLVYRRRPDLSLFADLERGDWGRTGRILLGGAGIGLLWEGYNYWARGKWIYTVPWLEELKLFEMPPFGFVGFPFFALEAWAMYHALCVARVALPLDHPGEVRRARLVPAIIVTAVLGVGILRGMERETISSVVPALDDLPGVTVADAARLRQAGVRSPFVLARRDSAWVAQQGIAGRAGTVVDAARLATLRGIGAGRAQALYTLGIEDVCALARHDPAPLWRALQEVTPDNQRRPSAAEVHVWLRAAGRACP